MKYILSTVLIAAIGSVFTGCSTVGHVKSPINTDNANDRMNINYKDRIDTLSATQLLQLLDKGELTSRELTNHFIGRIRFVNPGLNAVVKDYFEDALVKAARADSLYQQGKRDGKLQGLPFTIKECLDLKGSASTLGLKRRSTFISPKTDSYVAAMQKEGGIVLGKTNLPQLLMFIESSNRVYGVTNNPYNYRYSPGGSSGGEAAIIAAGGSPLGLGTDLGGSLRIPAAFCGICSIKPTMTRTVDHTRFIADPPPMSINSVLGVMANYAEDLQLGLEIINDQAANERQVEQLKNFRDVDISKLKIGYFLSDKIFEPMPAVKRAVLESVEELKKSGAQVIEFTPPLLPEAEEIFFKILSADGAPMFSENLDSEKPMRQAKGLLMIIKASAVKRKLLQCLAGISGQKNMKRLIAYFGGKGQAFHQDMERKQKLFAEKYETAMDNSPIGPLDAIISPVYPLPAILHNTSDKVGIGGTYTLQYNVTGFPAGVATVSKVHHGEATGRKKTADLLVRTASRIEAGTEGLPLAVQIAARPWNEHIVIALINKLHKRIYPATIQN